MKNLQISDLMEVYGKLLKDKSLEIMRCYFDCDMSLGEIAENFGITRQGAFDYISKGEKALLDYEDKLQVYRKSIELNTRIARAISLIEQQDYNQAIDILRQD